MEIERKRERERQRDIERYEENICLKREKWVTIGMDFILQVWINKF